MSPLYSGFNLISHFVVTLTYVFFVSSAVLVLSGLAFLVYTLLKRRKTK